MSSSTSSSEPFAVSSAPSDAAAWAGFARILLATAALVTAAILALAVLLDPYDTGRTPFAFERGVRPQGPRTAAASRARDPAFNAAIFGNSHVQLLSPQGLSAATGTAFVSLIAPATGPRETLVLIDWFLRHHKRPPAALVIGIDSYWCTANPELPNEKPFPFWLYSPSFRDYVFGLMRFDLLEEIPRRLGRLVSGKGERARPDGYWDYEPNYRLLGYETDPAIRARLAVPADTSGGNTTGFFPAATRLEALLRAAPAETALVLLRPPVYATALPAPGSPAKSADAACTQAFAGLAARRPRSALIDWRVDRPELHDPALFFDHTHYAQRIARLVEADIAAALARLR
jgi:hypothetical protein